MIKFQSTLISISSHPTWWNTVVSWLIKNNISSVSNNPWKVWVFSFPWCTVILANGQKSLSLQKAMKKMYCTYLWYYHKVLPQRKVCCLPFLQGILEICDVIKVWGLGDPAQWPKINPTFITPNVFWFWVQLSRSSMILGHYPSTSVLRTFDQCVCC